MRKALVIILVALLIVGPYPGVGEESTVVFDGAPCIELLINMLNSIVTADYERFNWSMWWFSQVDPPGDVAYIHNRTAELLRELAHYLQEYEDRKSEVLELVRQNKCLEAEELLGEAKKFYIEAYKIKLKLIDEDLLRRYFERMLKHVCAHERVVMRRSFEEAMNSFVNYVEAQRLEIIKLENEILYCKFGERINLIIHVEPLTVETGGIIKVSGEVLGATTQNNNAYFRVMLKIGGIIVSQVEIPYTQKFSVMLQVPGFEELHKFVGDTYPTKARVEIVYLTNNTVLAYNTTMIEIVAYKPNVVFECPSSVKYNESITIPVKVKSEHPLNTIIYIDGKDIYNVTLYPNTTELVLEWNRNFTPGYHTLTFKVAGKGKYVTTRYSCALAITVEAPSIDIIVDSLSIYPFTGTRIFGKIVFSKLTDYVVEIVSGDEVRKVINGSGKEQPIDLVLSPKPPIIIGFEDVVIRVHNLELGTVFEYRHQVVVVNVLGLLSALLLLLIALMIPPSKDVVELPTFLMGRLKTLLSKRFSSGKIQSVKPITTKICFRPSRLTRIYYRVLRKFSGLVGWIMPSETLREYLQRTEKYLENKLLEPFRKLTILFEKDLYSKQGVSEEEFLEAERIGRELESGA